MIRELFARGWADETFLATHADGVAELRAAAEPWTFERAAGEAGVDASAIATARRMVRDDVAGRHPLRLGAGTQPQRRLGDARDPGAARGRREVWRSRWRLHHEQLRGLWHQAGRARSASRQPDSRVVNMNQLGRALTEYRDPPVSVLFVYNCNPLSTMPDQNRVRAGLTREDLFTVVHEQVMTDTATSPTSCCRRRRSSSITTSRRATARITCS